MSEALNRSDVGKLMRVRCDGQGEAVVVHVGGEVDLVTAPRLAGELISAEEQSVPPTRLVIDLTEVTFLASAGLQVLLEYELRCRTTNIELFVVVHEGSVARTMAMMGLTEVLAVRPSLAEALQATP
jgi:anti-anti-sigma factor